MKIQRVRHLMAALVIFLCSFLANAQIIVVSDIDDTIKASNSMGHWYETLYHFLRGKPYPEMRDLYRQLEAKAKQVNEPITFYYVTAAPKFLKFAANWPWKHGFPRGQGGLVVMKPSGGISSYQYKVQTIERLISRHRDFQNAQFYFFGDNSSYDAAAYQAIINKYQLKKANVYIRNVKVNNQIEPLSDKSTLPLGGRYFISEVELIGQAPLSFMSQGLKDRMWAKHLKGKLIPKYTLRTFMRRITSWLTPFFHGKCKKKCQALSLKHYRSYWKRYHHRTKVLIYPQIIKAKSL